MVIDTGLAVGLAPILFAMGVIGYGVRRKAGAVLLVVAGLLWLWAFRTEKDAWILLGWLGVLVSIGGVLAYIEAVKHEILNGVRRPPHDADEGG